MTPPATPIPSTPVTGAGETMRAVVHAEYGDAEVLHVAHIERPRLAKPDEVLVQVRAAAVDRGTWHTMTGTPYAMRLAGFGVRRPKKPVQGRDLAGVVVAVGRDVTRLAPGDEVFGTGKGSLAEFAVSRERTLARKPPGLTFEQAAAVPVSGLTALQALTDVGRLAAGQRVLITGASGGVGTYAVQIAKSFDAEVTAVCSTTKVDLVRSLGADHVVDYTVDGVIPEGEQYDLIVDIAGNTPLKRLRQALTPHGTVVIVGGEGAGRILGIGRQLRAVALSPFVPQRLAMLASAEKASDLERLADLVAAGAFVPVIERVYPLEDTPAAMAHLAAGNARGKLVIAVAP